jgi:hypothetical protein
MHLQENMKSSCSSLVWGQCTDVMRTRLQALDDCDDISEKGDLLALLNAIKVLVCNFQSQKCKPRALHDGKRGFYLLSQDKHITWQACLESFITVWRHQTLWGIRRTRTRTDKLQDTGGKWKVI